MPTGSWGNIIQFTVSSTQALPLDNITRQKTARFAEHDIVGQPPRYEFVGPGLGTFSAEVYLGAPLGVVPRAILDQLQAACDAGTSAILVINGANVFRVGSLAVLDSISEAWSTFTGSGGLVTARGTLVWHEVAQVQTAQTTTVAGTKLVKANVKRIP